MLGHFDHVLLYATIQTIATQGLSRQKYWSGLLCPLAGELPDPGIKSKSLMSHALASRFFTTWEVVKSTTWEAPKQNTKSWLIEKDSDTGRDWGQEDKGMTEDEMAGWYHWLNGRESEWTPGVGDGQGSLACCNSWGRKESDTTERLNWTEALYYITHKN